MKSFASLIHKTRQRFAGLTDSRRGKNTRYSMEDSATSSFSVFFTQSPSFLAYQKAMQQNKGRSNAQSLFQIEKIPCDNQIRDCLDPVAPEEIFPLYDEALQALQEHSVCPVDYLLDAVLGFWQRAIRDYLRARSPSRDYRTVESRRRRLVPATAESTAVPII
jgi:hypothetical protein